MQYFAACSQEHDDKHIVFEGRLRERPIIRMDLQIRTMFGFVLTHPPLNTNIHDKKILTLWKFHCKDSFP